MANEPKSTTTKPKTKTTTASGGTKKTTPKTAAKSASGTKTATAKSPSTTTSTPSKSATTTKSGSKGATTSSSKKSSSKSATDVAKDTLSSATSAAKSATSHAKDTLTSATSAAKNNPGKVLAAAGVAAATAAGYAVYRATRGSGNTSSDGRSVYHILPAEDGWQIKGAGASRAVSKHDTKKDALAAARDLAHNQVPSQLVVHRSDGTIQESWSYDAEN